MAKKKSSKKKSSAEYQKEYYAKNRDKLAAERARRYREDPEYKERMQQVSRRRYWLGTRLATTGAGSKVVSSVRLQDIPAKGAVSVTVTDPTDTRYGTVVNVPVFTTAALEVLVGRGSQTIRLWLKDGTLPESCFRGRDFPGVKIAKGRNPRLFTYDEMAAIEACRSNLVLPSQGQKHAIFSECVAAKFAAMTAGLVPTKRA